MQSPPAQAQVELHGGPVESSTVPTLIGSVEIAEGELVVIRTVNAADTEGSSNSEIVRFEPDAGIDSWYVMFNTVESMANPVVAVR